MNAVRLSLLFPILLVALAACSESHRNLVSDPPQLEQRDGDSRLDSGPATAATLDAAISSSVPNLDTAVALCGKRACSCNDGKDNDGDGLEDGLDPECTGSSDDDEASFATGQPNKHSVCRDCYWDANSGKGDDGCRYPEQCLTDSQFNEGQGSCRSCNVADACVSHCKARTPNGCDCFGCCAVTRDSGEVVTVELRDGCNLAKLDDNAACPRCTPSESCKNDCARCELCLGKTIADLPADCRSGTGPGYACEGGLRVCSPAAPCPAGFYCQQGCCMVDLL